MKVKQATKAKLNLEEKVRTVKQSMEEKVFSKITKFLSSLSVLYIPKHIQNMFEYFDKEASEQEKKNFVEWFYDCDINAISPTVTLSIKDSYVKEIVKELAVLELATDFFETKKTMKDFLEK